MPDLEPAFDIGWLSDLYGIGFQSIEPVVRGVNLTFRVATSDSAYFLRLYRVSGRTPEDIDFELEVLSGYPGNDMVGVARPISAKHGMRRQTVSWGDEQRSFCLFETAAGQRPEDSDVELFRLGRDLASLHNGLQKVAVTGQRRLLPEDIYKEAHRNFPQMEEQGIALRTLFDSLRDYAVERLQRDGANVAIGLCHGDVWAYNVHFSERVTTFFDFDDCGFGPLAFDLSTLAFHLFHAHGPKCLDRLQSVLIGYRSVREIGDADIALIPALVAVNQLRSIDFLAAYCLLNDALWHDSLASASRLTAFWTDPELLRAMADILRRA